MGLYDMLTFGIEMVSEVFGSIFFALVYLIYYAVAGMGYGLEVIYELASYIIEMGFYGIEVFVYLIWMVPEAIGYGLEGTWDYLSTTSIVDMFEDIGFLIDDAIFDVVDIAYVLVWYSGYFIVAGVKELFVGFEDMADSGFLYWAASVLILMLW